MFIGRCNFFCIKVIFKNHLLSRNCVGDFGQNQKVPLSENPGTTNVGPFSYRNPTSLRGVLSDGRTHLEMGFL